ncbi:hypothetical protein C440_03293 [Haloferax mucosum ATCC BAA-1512]|uniref:Uncharacterized protein n=1 Tax=Haloferax mucosum ATCC BAA-1512 TaxID=662479 RepID=M0IIY9_9EURY|nr:hypothetical protein [Haloferax mucosum]ELZ96766.1 hypothetical protein C440_03293 [Haloferax mucosum ATCC BAA-1512]
MSNSSSTVPRERLSQLREKVTDEQQLSTGLRLVTAPVRFVGFWAAVALPFLYLPLLVGGLSETVTLSANLSGNELTVFVALVTLNVVALVIGHDYARS